MLLGIKVTVCIKLDFGMTFLFLLYFQLIVRSYAINTDVGGTLLIESSSQIYLDVKSEQTMITNYTHVHM